MRWHDLRHTFASQLAMENVRLRQVQEWLGQPRGPLHANLEGFDLHAHLAVAADRPERRRPLEELVRYCARPALADHRLARLPDGRVVLQLKAPWRDGTTHVLYEPLDFIARLAALVPRPRKNQVLYHGVLAANASWRARVLAHGRAASADPPPLSPRQHAPARRRYSWAELMRRAFGFDVLSRPRCAGKMVLLACILERAAKRTRSRVTSWRRS